MLNTPSNVPKDHNRSSSTTRGVRVDVASQFMPEHSSPKDDFYLFIYTVRIANTGDCPVRLLNRHWIILDKWGETQEVRGPGVVGEQPHLKPGEVFEYTSSCPLKTDSGTMHGSYEMIDDDGQTFEAVIALFHLGDPGVMH